MREMKMRDMIMGERIMRKSKFGMLTRESVSIITVGKYNRISTPRVLMLENSPCDVDGEQLQISGCWFHYAQAVIRRMKKLGLQDSGTDTVGVSVCSLAPSPTIQ